MGLSDPYLIFYSNDTAGKEREVLRTEVVKKDLNPHFKEKELIPYELVGKDINNSLRIECWDWDMSTPDDFIGQVTVKLPELFEKAADLKPGPEHKLTHSFPFKTKKGKVKKELGSLEVTFYLKLSAAEKVTVSEINEFKNQAQEALDSSDLSVVQAANLLEFLDYLVETYKKLPEAHQKEYKEQSEIVFKLQKKMQNDLENGKFKSKKGELSIEKLHSDEIENDFLMITLSRYVYIVDPKKSDEVPKMLKFVNSVSKEQFELDLDLVYDPKMNKGKYFIFSHLHKVTDVVHVFIVYQGTIFKADAVTDVKIAQTKFFKKNPELAEAFSKFFGSNKNSELTKADYEECAVHAGFYKYFTPGWASVVQTIAGLQIKYPKKKFDFEIAGHSLGGAQATLCAMFLAAWLKTKDAPQTNKPITVVTIGSPRVGERKHFAKIFHHMEKFFLVEYRRYVNAAVGRWYIPIKLRSSVDLVAQYPIGIANEHFYRHVGDEVLLLDEKWKTYLNSAIETGLLHLSSVYYTNMERAAQRRNVSLYYSEKCNERFNEDSKKDK